ncbi:MAG: DUF420 domain-containing protein [Chthoniobacter sp.]
MHASDLPIVNASLNALSTVFILAGITFIKNDRKQAHIVSMLCALVTSTLFWLLCHLSRAQAGCRHALHLSRLAEGALLSHSLHAHPAGLPHRAARVHDDHPAFKGIYDKHRRIAQ